MTLIETKLKGLINISPVLLLSEKYDVIKLNMLPEIHRITDS